MSIPADIQLDNSSRPGPEWLEERSWHENVASYRCHVRLVKEDDGTFSAIVLNLPGAGSCGDTEEEAILNVREAVCGVIGSYEADGEPVPWRDPFSYSDEIPDDAKHKWILVNA
jgi:predicted RNase H-like HicB family nuclease